MISGNGRGIGRCIAVLVDRLCRCVAMLTSPFVPAYILRMWLEFD